MLVTYQVNYLEKFSGNACDISSQPYHLIFWQCVWQIRQSVSLYHPILWQCPWHIRPTTLLNFMTLRVTYQVNLSIKFSDIMSNKSGKLYHCIIPFSDNVCDISGQLPCLIFWQCVWPINSILSSNFLTICVTNQVNCITVSSHFPTMSVTYQVNYLFQSSDNVCDISI